MFGIFGRVEIDRNHAVDPQGFVDRHAAELHVDAKPGHGAALGFSSTRPGVASSRFSRAAGTTRKALEVVAVGEIFNAPDVVGSAKSTTPGDVATVIAELHDQNDLGRLASANGMFCAAVYEPASHTLVLVTDRIGGYPLHVWRSDKALCFATNLHIILGAPDIPRRLDKDGLSRVFAMNRTFGATTNIAGVEALPAASILRCALPRVAKDTYWQMTWTAPSTDRKAMAHRVADGLRHALERQTVGERVGMFMSGGLDSRAILAAAPSGSVSCWTTASYEENPELRIARDVSQYFGAEHHTLIVEPGDILPQLDKAVRDTNGLYPASNAFTSFALPTAESCDHILTGYALDNALRGNYLPIRYLNVLGASPRIPKLEPIPDAPTGHDVLASFRHFTKRATVERILKRSWLEEWWPAFEDEVDGALRPWLESAWPENAWDAFVFKNVSQHYSFTLVMATRGAANMRIPAFDAELYDLFLESPPEWRCTGELVHEAMKILSPQGAAMINANTGFRMDHNVWVELALLMGRGALRRLGLIERPRVPKAGQSTGSWQDTRVMYQQEPAHRQRLEEIRARVSDVSFDFLDPDGLSACIDEHFAGANDHTKLLRFLMTYDAWLRQYDIEGC